MRVSPRTRRAKSRLAEHTLVIERVGMFRGESAVLCRCADGSCPWLGWLTASELVPDGGPLATARVGTALESAAGEQRGGVA
jgi:hypothetical protein